MWTIAGRPWQKEASEEYQAMHPEVVVNIEEVPYGDMAKKQLTQLATGTMQDLTYTGVKWYAYAAYKGAFLALNDLIDKTAFDMEDFTEYTKKGIEQDSKYFGLPFEMNLATPSPSTITRTSWRKRACLSRRRTMSGAGPNTSSAPSL